MSEKSNDTLDDNKKKVLVGNESTELTNTKNTSHDGLQTRVRIKQRLKPLTFPEVLKDNIIKSFHIHSKTKPDSNEPDWNSRIEHYKNELKNTGKSDDLLKIFWLMPLGESYLKIGAYYEFLKIFKRLSKILHSLNLEDLPIFSEKINDIDKELLSCELIHEVSKKTRTIYGNNPKLINAFVDAINYGLDDEPCLIIGETGTGKEIIAELIHKISNRKDNKFWPVNCGGFTASLFNSEIQGVAPDTATQVAARLGAFLNACGKKSDEKNKAYYIHHDKNKTYIHCMIDGKNEPDPTYEQLAPLCGTLFLDEINSLPMGLQSNLLRIIQEKEVQVTGEDIKRKFAAKVICATNKEITGNEEFYGLRKDLYYRLTKGIIFLPCLREMTNSIPSIAKQMVNDMSDKLNYGKVEVSKSALNKMMNYHWPGNHRELENVLYRAFKKMMLNNERKMEFGDIDFMNIPMEERLKESIFEGKDLYQVNKMFVDYLLNRTEGNKTEAKQLGGFRNTKDIHEILNPKHESYKTTRFSKCKSLINDK